MAQTEVPASPVTAPDYLLVQDETEKTDSDTSATPSKSIPRITVQTNGDAISSGFPYDAKLKDLITAEEWRALTTEIVNAAKLTFKENSAAWKRGALTGILGAPIMMMFAPVGGYYAGRSVHRKTVVKAVKERLNKDGKIGAILQQYNEKTFKGRGFSVWLEVPSDGGEGALEKEKEAPATAAKKEKRFKIVVVPQ